MVVIVRGGIQSILSGLEGRGLNRDHKLVRHVQQNTGIQDPETARQYTQHGVYIVNEQSRSNHRDCNPYLAIF